MSQYRCSAAVAVLVAALLAAPARADHQDKEDHAHPAAAAAAPMHDAAPADIEAMPSNDLSAAAASQISAAGADPAGTLHTTPKVMNNVGLSNDMKSALQATKPSVGTQKPRLEAIAKPAAIEPAPGASAHEPAATANAAPQGYELDVRSAAPDAAAPSIAADPAPAARGFPLPALIGVGGLALAAGFFLSRMMRKAP